MTARLATILIFLFCGTMTVLLVRSVLYPEESRLADVAPQVPFDLFVARAEGSQLDIWDAQRITGDCHIEPQGVSPNPLAKTDKVNIRVSIRLILSQQIKDKMGYQRIDVSGDAVLHADGRVGDFDLKFTLAGTQSPIRLFIKQTEDQKSPALKLMSGNAVVFESSAGKLLEGPDSLIADGMLQALGIPPDALLRKQAESTAASTVRSGNIEAGGQSFNGFLFTSGADEETKFRLYMSNTGEILRIKTPLGLEMLAESLRPKGTEAPKLERQSQTRNTP